MKIRILLVDDEDHFRQTLKRRLLKRGLEVREADCGVAALVALSESPADVVVLDVRMPGMNGIETLREIKTRHPSIEVILLTGQVDLGNAMKGMDLGALDYCIKPMDIDDLYDKIGVAYERKQLHEEGRVRIARC